MSCCDSARNFVNIPLNLVVVLFNWFKPISICNLMSSLSDNFCSAFQSCNNSEKSWRKCIDVHRTIMSLYFWSSLRHWQSVLWYHWIYGDLFLQQSRQSRLISSCSRWWLASPSSHRTAHPPTKRCVTAWHTRTNKVRIGLQNMLELTSSDNLVPSCGSFMWLSVYSASLISFLALFSISIAVYFK